MILAAKYARENRIPYFGICLGMQIAVIEFARNAAGIQDAHSGEFDEQCAHKVIDFMPVKVKRSIRAEHCGLEVILAALKQGRCWKNVTA